jgi:hypothetical protein
VLPGETTVRAPSPFFACAHLTTDQSHGGRLWPHRERPEHGWYRNLGGLRCSHGEESIGGSAQERTTTTTRRRRRGPRVPDAANKVGDRVGHRAWRAGARQRAHGTRAPSSTGQLLLLGPCMACSPGSPHDRVRDVCLGFDHGRSVWPLHPNPKPQQAALESWNGNLASGTTPYQVASINSITYQVTPPPTAQMISACFERN